MTVTGTEIDTAGSLGSVAVMITTFGLGAFAGAVYAPVGLIVPHAVAVQPLPDSDHCTAVFVVPLTVAENC